MNEYIEVAKAAANLGIGGLVVIAGWRLTDRWAGRLVAAQEGQAAAMTALASAVKEGEGDQREVLLAVRVMAGKLDELRDAVREVRNGQG